MKQHIQLFLTFLAAATIAFADEYEASTVAKIGTEAPDFSYETLAGASHSLSDHKGKVVLINFFATWCGPCMQEMPHLNNDLYPKFKDNEAFVILTIGREHSPKELKQFKQAKGLSIPLIADGDRSIYAKYADSYIPRNFVVGKDGMIKLAEVGYTEKDFQALMDLIANELEQ